MVLSSRQKLWRKTSAAAEGKGVVLAAMERLSRTLLLHARKWQLVETTPHHTSKKSEREQA
jgi:hypothetical protein